MDSQSKSIIRVLCVIVACGLGTGCDNQPRVGLSHALQRTHRAADEAPTVDKSSSAPSIVRESVDARCFGPPQEDNTQVVACPQVMQLAMAAE